MDKFTRDALEAFYTDSRVVELCELLRTGDEVLDVIGLSENQHSDILAWLLDPREGHGQGDQILRDLLIAATISSRTSDSLDRRGMTSRFFAEWSASRIRTTSFGSAFVARELGMKAKERVDLFVIDPQNKFVLLIENKAGMHHSSQQLDTYKKNFEDITQGNANLRGYDCAFIALDRYLLDDDDRELPAARSWLHLGYDWLKVSANRAIMHMERGNTAARLVVSYCNRQTDWESPQEKKAIEIASGLHHDHRKAIDYLLAMSIRRIEAEWLGSTKPTVELLFMLQNRSLESLLRETQGMASVVSTLLTRLPGLRSDLLDHGRGWIEICPTGWDRYFNGDWWPVYLRITYTDKERSRFRIVLVWNSHYARSESEAEHLRDLLSEYNPQFLKHGEATRRWVILDHDIGLSDVFQRVAEIFRDLSTLPTLAEAGR